MNTGVCRVIDVALLIVWGLVTWCVSGEGGFGAALNCVVVLLSGLLAMNFFEPMADFCQASLLSSGSWPYYWDVIALVGLFAALVTGIRMGLEKLSPRYFEMSGLTAEIARWGFGLLAGYATMAFLLTALHTAPYPREFFGFRPERANLFGVMAPDRQWLGFTQFVSENSLARSGGPRIFDGPMADFVDDPAATARNTVWPSFPLRYATRRRMFATGGLGQPAPVAVQPVPVTPGSGGTGAAGF